MFCQRIYSKVHCNLRSVFPYTRHTHPYIHIRNSPSAFILFLRTLSIAIFSLLPIFSQAQTVTDPGLDAAIRVTISKPIGTITPADLLSMSVLSAACRSITNLAGINGALNLSTLDLGDNS